MTRETINRFYKRHHQDVNTRTVPFEDKKVFYEKTMLAKANSKMSTADRKAKQREREYQERMAITVPVHVAAVHETELKIYNKTKCKMLKGKISKREHNHPALKGAYLISKEMRVTRSRPVKVMSFAPETLIQITDKRVTVS